MTARRKIGLTLIALVAICGLFAPFLAPFNPVSSGIDPLEGASARHWLGTDPLGRDVLSRVIYGARISLMVGIGPEARVDHYFTQCRRCWMRDCGYRRAVA